MCYMKIMKKQFRRASYNFQVDQDTYKIVIICLEELAKTGDYCRVVVQNFRSQVSEILVLGNIELVQRFVDVGFNLWEAFPQTLSLIENNRVDTIRYLLKNRYDLSNDWIPILALMHQTELTAELFELCFRRGLPLHFDNRTNWLEASLCDGLLDLAVVAYRHGLRLSKDKIDSHYISFKATPCQFADHLVRKRCTDEFMIILAGAFRGDTSIFSLLPRELVLSELGKTVYDLEIADELKIIFGLTDYFHTMRLI